MIFSEKILAQTKSENFTHERQQTQRSILIQLRGCAMQKRWASKI